MKLPQITNNLVLVLPDSNFDTVAGMALADDFEPNKHVSVQGQVLVVPNNLICDSVVAKKGLAFSGYSEGLKMVQQAAFHSLEMATDMELIVGDRVAFRYNAHMNAEDDGLYWQLDDGRKAIFMNYDLLYMAIREQQYYMLNGWILVEPIERTLQEVLDMHGGMYRQMADETSDGVGIVRHIGKPVRDYKWSFYQDVDEVKVGDKVLFPKSLKTPIEWAAHKELNEGKFPYFRLQRKDILAIKI